MKITSIALFCLVLCAEGAKEKTSSPTKKVKCTRELMTAISDCAQGVKPSKGTDGCPSCLPKAFDKVKCTKSVIKECAAPAACAAGEKPKRDGCCLSCKVQKAPKCTVEQKDTCKASIDSLGECAADADKKSVFDVDTCCVTCKRAPRPDPTKKCTKADFETCIDTAPECAAKEKPVREKGQCCVSCRRPAREAPLREVGKCGAIGVCATDETPTRVKDESGAFACPSCKRAKAVCSTACSDGQLCVRKKKSEEANNTEGECRGKKAKKLRMLAKSAVNKAFLKGASADEIKATLQEIVDRFCDNEEHADQCEKFQATLTDGMVVKKVTSKNDEIEVQVEVPEEVVVSRRLTSRRLADDAGSLLDAAMADPDAAGGDISVTSEEVVNKALDDGSAVAGNSQSFLTYSSSVLVVCGAMVPILGAGLF